MKTKIHSTIYEVFDCRTKETTINILQQYYKTNKQKPHKVIYLFGCADVSATAPKDKIIKILE